MARVCATRWADVHHTLVSVCGGTETTFTDAVMEAEA
jgi:hypothetical protein